LDACRSRRRRNRRGWLRAEEMPRNEGSGPRRSGISVGAVSQLAQGPMTGMCIYALAFSTLLSSQGADAHQLEALRLFIGGNPTNLPYRASRVNLAGDLDRSRALAGSSLLPTSAPGPHLPTPGADAALPPRAGPPSRKGRLVRYAARPRGQTGSYRLSSTWPATVLRSRR
jgi:hypothetical protein